ncbi:MAG: helix-hairpin-helix domain-containing protein [Bacteroidaceae bacterium]|nr:helix-hairpin-helix domain-containing protein [Bacteroidaceae bacterium]
MKRLPTLTNAQRRALLLVEWVLLIGIIALAIFKNTPPVRRLLSEPSYERRDAGRRNVSHASGRWVGSVPEERPVESFPFDPNTADSTTLLRLGLSPWQVRSIYRYRAKLGRYHTPEDFMNLPNLTVEQWERLKPYVRIAPRFRYVEPAPRRQYSQRVPVVYEVAEMPLARQDSLPRQEKIAFGETVDISTADTSQLKMIPGIASKRAARIVAYRRQLGGFVNVEQAMEAIEMPDSVLRYMTVSPAEVRKINVNKLSVQQMMKHPYLSFYQAKAIFEHRRNKGDLHSLDELSRLEGFRQTDIDRLRPYITFE